MYKGGRNLLPRSSRSLINPGPLPLSTLTDIQKRGSLGGRSHAVRAERVVAKGSVSMPKNDVIVGFVIMSCAL
jgi:hypothetical protein